MGKGKVYWDKPAIPIPDGLTPKPSDGRVSVYVDVNGVKALRTIGYAATSYTMFVNDFFKEMYPNEWERYYGKEELQPDRLYIGCYALTFGIIHKTGLYTLLLQAYDPGITNAVLDYAMYSILDRSDVTQLYPIRMQEEVLFSNQVYSDSWYSDFFKRTMNTKAIHEFRLKWLMHCKEKGVTKVWLSIDGSNDDCEVKESDLSEYGYAKSHNESKLVSFIYAVNAEDGRPVTYFVNPGSVVDSKAFMEIAMLLKQASIEIEGVILDSTFCVYDLIQTIISCGYDFVIMTPCDTYGHTSVMKTDGEKIRWKSEYCVSDEGGIFGTTKRHVLFGNHPDLEVYINLYFDGLRGARQSKDLSKSIRKEMRRVQDKLDSGKNGSIKSEFSSYLSIKLIDGHKTVVPNNENWDSKMMRKGYFSIATSKDFGAEKTLWIYHLRDTSEVGYCFIKSHQGFSAIRVHSTEGIYSKFAVCFVGNIIRQEIVLACKELDLDTNEMIRKLDRIYLRRGYENSYFNVKMQTTEQVKLLGTFNIEPDDFSQFATDVNKRRNAQISNNVYTMPVHEKPAPVQNTNKRGRKKGSKNKKTLEKEAAIQAMILCGLDPSALNPKNPVGRPKGKKDSVQRRRRTKAEIAASREKAKEASSGIAG